MSYSQEYKCIVAWLNLVSTLPKWDELRNPKLSEIMQRRISLRSTQMYGMRVCIFEHE